MVLVKIDVETSGGLGIVAETIDAESIVLVILVLARIDEEIVVLAVIGEEMVVLARIDEEIVVLAVIGEEMVVLARIDEEIVVLAEIDEGIVGVVVIDEGRNVEEGIDGETRMVHEHDLERQGDDVVYGSSPTDSCSMESKTMMESMER